MDKSHSIMWTGIIIFLLGLSFFFYSMTTYQVGPKTAEYCWDLGNAIENGMLNNYVLHGYEEAHIDIPKCFDVKNFKGENLDLRKWSPKYIREGEAIFDCDVKSQEVSCSPYRLQIGDVYGDFNFSYRVSGDKLYIGVKEIERKEETRLENFHVIIIFMIVGTSLILYGSFYGKKPKK